MRAAALLLLLPGCDVVFGLDRDRLPIDAAVDASPDFVTGELLHRFVMNAPTGAPVEFQEPDRDVGLSVSFDDGSEPTALVIDPGLGTFSFARPAGAPYRLIATSARDGHVPTEWQTSLPALSLVAMTAGRPMREPVTLSTPLTFTTPTAPGTHVVLSTGVWTETAIPGDVLDWKQAFASGPPLGLLDASKSDQLFYVVRSVFADTATGLTYTAFLSEATKAVTIVDGMPQNIALAFATSVRDQCAKIAAPRAAAMQRVALAAGPGTTPASDDWIIHAAPNPALGPVGVLTLAFHVEVPPTVPSNQIINVAYRNPFPGHSSIASMGAFYGRTIAAPGASGLVLTTGARVYTPVLPCPALTALELTQGIPGALSLAGVQLTGPDGTVVPVDANAPLSLSWSLAASGPVDVSSATIYEVVAQNGKTSLVPVRQFKTLGQSVTIAANVLQPQTSYVARVDAAIGYPDAATGDLRTVQYPYGNVTQWSRVFQISHP